MPYNDRPLNKGGNRGIDVDFSRKAPKGKFRVICVDTFDGTDWIVGDYKDFLDARRAATVRMGKLLKVYIYNNKGKCLNF